VNESIRNIIDDLAVDFVYYDRKDDEVIPVAELNRLIISGELTVDDVVDQFRAALSETFAQVVDSAGRG
jgi:hypothetical protein